MLRYYAGGYNKEPSIRAKNVHSNKHQFTNIYIHIINKLLNINIIDYGVRVQHTIVRV